MRGEGKGRGGGERGERGGGGAGHKEIGEGKRRKRGGRQVVGSGRDRET